MNSVNEPKQVGGTHYGTGFGHWDYCKLACTPYLEGAATKYLFRWRKKNGIQDLEKGLTFLEKLMYGMTIHTVNEDAWNREFLGILEDAFNQQQVPPAERLIIEAIFTWKTYNDLLWARDQYMSFIQQAKAEETGSNYTNQG